MAIAPIPFFTDNNVPDSVGHSILAAGHELTRLRQVMPHNSEDKSVAAACVMSGLVLVSFDNDFNGIAERLNMSQTAARGLHRIDMQCFEPDGASRIRDAMSLIEHEWRYAKILGIPLLVQIGKNHIRVRR
jgi:hypothetical protein